MNNSGDSEAADSPLTDSADLHLTNDKRRHTVST